jgi:hypothetical protein
MLIFSLMIIFLSSCGVNTSSSPTEQSNSDTSTDSNTDNSNQVGLDLEVGLDLIDPNPVYSDTNDTNDGITDNTTDNNTTDDETVVADQNNSSFDVSNAVLDQYACMIGDPNLGYTNNQIFDTSSDSKSEEDIEDGVLINSSFMIDRTDPESSKAILFYSDLKVQRDMVYQYVFATRYYIAVDTAWARNDKKVVYVMTPKNTDGYFGCYRYDFSLLSEGTYTSTKVYRNNK